MIYKSWIIRRIRMMPKRFYKNVTQCKTRLNNSISVMCMFGKKIFYLGELIRVNGNQSCIEDLHF